MNDFNEVVKRVTTDHAFREDLLSDLKGTLGAHNYTCTGEELAELAQLDRAKLDQLDEGLLQQVVGGVTTSTLNLSPTLTTGLPLFNASLTSLNQQNFFTGFKRPGVTAAGSW